jgi:two-component system, OmpR family, alkaline phosphatase synthesis response regulator PhoP
MNKVLLIEDDAAISRALADNLTHEGYEAVTAATGEEGYVRRKSFNPDLIVLDLMLPGMSGLELCRKFRSEGIQTPILMLTAKSEESDRVLGLDLGADDYVTKPFSLRELMARVRALLRRTHAAAQLPEELRFGDVEVDFRRYVARRRGRVIEMTRKEFATLQFLAARAGEAVTRDELLNEVWGYDALPISRTVDNHIAALRAKLEDDPARPVHILTVHRVGYKFTHDALS